MTPTSATLAAAIIAACHAVLAVARAIDAIFTRRKL